MSIQAGNVLGVGKISVIDLSKKHGPKSPSKEERETAVLVQMSRELQGKYDSASLMKRTILCTKAFMRMVGIVTQSGSPLNSEYVEFLSHEGTCNIVYKMVEGERQRLNDEFEKLKKDKPALSYEKYLQTKDVKKERGKRVWKEVKAIIAMRNRVDADEEVRRLYRDIGGPRVWVEGVADELEQTMDEFDVGVETMPQKAGDEYDLISRIQITYGLVQVHVSESTSRSTMLERLTTVIKRIRKGMNIIQRLKGTKHPTVNVVRTAQIEYTQFVEYVKSLKEVQIEVLTNRWMEETEVSVGEWSERKTVLEASMRMAVAYALLMTVGHMIVSPEIVVQKLIRWLLAGTTKTKVHEEIAQRIEEASTTESLQEAMEDGITLYNEGDADSIAMYPAQGTIPTVTVKKKYDQEKIFLFCGTAERKQTYHFSDKEAYRFGNTLVSEKIRGKRVVSGMEDKFVDMLSNRGTVLLNKQDVPVTGLFICMLNILRECADDKDSIFNIGIYGSLWTAATSEIDERTEDFYKRLFKARFPRDVTVLNDKAGGPGRGQRMNAILYYVDELDLSDEWIPKGNFGCWLERGRKRTAEEKEAMPTLKCEEYLNCSDLECYVVKGQDGTEYVKGCRMNGTDYKVLPDDTGKKLHVTGRAQADEFHLGEWCIMAVKLGNAKYFRDRPCT